MFLKMGGVLFASIFLFVLLFIWIVNGPMLYAIEVIDAQAEVSAPIPDPKKPEYRQFSVNYHDCRATTETIALGPQTLDAKAPTRLIEIRSCLEKLKPGQNVSVKIEARRQRITGKKTWRLMEIGSCAFPHLPSRISASSHGPCPWM
tara:strand:- start:382 stop:822 length:441 start_codon:yes stop_codon:yes gene_type:complete